MVIVLDDIPRQESTFDDSNKLIGMGPPSWKQRQVSSLNEY